MAMNVEYINPFLLSSASVLQSMCGMTLKAGKPYVKSTQFDTDHVVICIGITGQLSGQVLMDLKKETALDIASRMCMMQITKLDELGLSALSELGNMVLGNAATVISTKGIIIDITPPTIIQGNFYMDRSYAENICIPLSYDNGALELNVSIKEK